MVLLVQIILNRLNIKQNKKHTNRIASFKITFSTHQQWKRQEHINWWITYDKYQLLLHLIHFSFWHFNAVMW